MRQGVADDGSAWTDAPRVSNDSGVLTAPRPWDVSRTDRAEVNDESQPPERFPPWVAGVILVAYSGVFWVGLVTVVKWVVVGMSG